LLKVEVSSLSDLAYSAAPPPGYEWPAVAEIYPRSRQMELPFSSNANRFRHTADASCDPIPAVEGGPAKLMLLPIIDTFGVDRVHFGIVLQLALLIGIATPPMGIGLYIMVEVGKVPFERMAVAVLPSLTLVFVVLILITYVPSLTLWLPNLALRPE
jgi:hypothetical protein